MSVVVGIYGHFNRELSREAEEAMRCFVTQNPQNKCGVHRYSMQEYGLDPAEERRNFQDYTEYFGIEPEA
jgi:hypothetical protein